MKSKFEIYEDKIGEWRFRLIAGNGEIIAVSEGYKTKQNAKIGIKAVVNAIKQIITEERSDNV